MFSFKDLIHKIKFLSWLLYVFDSYFGIFNRVYSFLVTNGGSLLMQTAIDQNGFDRINLFINFTMSILYQVFIFLCRIFCDIIKLLMNMTLSFLSYICIFQWRILKNGIVHIYDIVNEIIKWNKMIHKKKSKFKKIFIWFKK